MAYIWSFSTAKMSFVCLYLKILADYRYYIFNRCLMVFLVLQAIEETFVVLFSCKPIPKLWSPLLQGQCLDLKVFYYAVVRHSTKPCGNHGAS